MIYSSPSPRRAKGLTRVYDISIDTKNHNKNVLTCLLLLLLFLLSILGLTERHDNITLVGSSSDTRDEGHLYRRHLGELTTS